MTDPDPALPEDPLAEVAGELYGLDPTAFVRERSARAAAARAAGDKDLARRISRLLVPTLSAWAINQLVRARPGLAGEIREVGALLRTAQGRLDGAALRELRPRREELLGTVVDEAASVAAGHGRVLSATARGEVRDSIVAALADEEAAADVCGGRLVRAVSYAGFGTLTPPAPPGEHEPSAPQAPHPEPPGQEETPVALAAASPAADRTTLRRAAKRRAAERQAAAAQRRAAEAARRVEQARAEVEAADQAMTAASLAEAQARRDVERAAARLTELRSMLTTAEEELAALRDEAAEAEDERALAATALATARTALDAAKAAEAATRTSGSR